MIFFDVVKINVGNNYYLNSGIFIVLSVGIYVFDWMIQSMWRGVVYMQLVRNLEVFGEVVVDSNYEYEFYSVIGVVVVQLSEGDEVFIRIYFMDVFIGYIISRLGYWFFFSGWRI